MTQESISVGTKVKWTSQSGGYRKEKRGVVVAVIIEKELGTDAPYQVADKMFPDHKRQFDGWIIPGGGEVGYFVEVIVGPRAKPRLYMPYPSKLEIDD